MSRYRDTPRGPTIYESACKFANEAHEAEKAGDPAKALYWLDQAMSLANQSNDVLVDALRASIERDIAHIKAQPASDCLARARAVFKEGRMQAIEWLRSARSMATLETGEGAEALRAEIAAELAHAQASLARIASRPRNVMSFAQERERDLSIVDNLTREASEMLTAALEIDDLAERLDKIGEATDMAERAQEILMRWT